VELCGLDDLVYWDVRFDRNAGGKVVATFFKKAPDKNGRITSETWPSEITFGMLARRLSK
jgi:hypothetical protein